MAHIRNQKKLTIYNYWSSRKNLINIIADHNCKLEHGFITCKSYLCLQLYYVTLQIHERIDVPSHDDFKLLKTFHVRSGIHHTKGKRIKSSYLMRLPQRSSTCTCDEKFFFELIINFKTKR